MAVKDVQFILSFDDKGSAQLRKVTAGVRKELDQLGKSTSKKTQAQTKSVAETKKQTSAFGKLKNAIKSNWAQMALGMGVMQGVSGAMRMVKMQVMSVINAGRDFERAWANTRTMIDETTVSHLKMRSELMQLPASLGPAEDLAKGLYQVLSASIDASDAIMVLEVSARSAVAGMTDTATSVDAITTVLNAYGLEAKEAEHVSDIMFQTVKRGKLTYESMAGALGTIVPIASQVGVKFTDVTGAMASLTKQGIDVNTATMQMRQILVSVLKPTKDAEIMAKRLGIEFNAQSLASMGLQKFLQMVKEATGGSAEAMTLLFGNVRALTGVMGLAGSGAKVFADDVKAMGDASGSTEVAFRKQMESADFQIKTFGTHVKKLKQLFYLGFVKQFKLSGQAIDEWIEKMSLAEAKAQIASEQSGKFFKTLWGGVKGLYKVVQPYQKAYREEMNLIAKAQVELSEKVKKFNVVLGKSKGAINKAKGSVIDYLDKMNKFKIAQEETGISSVELMGIFEELEIKTKLQLSVAMEILEDKFWAIQKSGKATESTISKLAKELIGMKKDLGIKVTPQLLAFTNQMKELGIVTRDSLIKELEKAEYSLENFRSAMTSKAIVDMEKKITDLRLQLRGMGGDIDTKVVKALAKIKIPDGLPDDVKDVSVSFLDNLLPAFKKTEDGIDKMSEDFIPKIAHSFAVTEIEVKNSAEGMYESINKVGKEIVVDWENISEQVKAKWVSAVSEIITQSSSLNDALDRIGKGILSIFGDIVGLMVMKWMGGIGKMGKSNKALEIGWNVTSKKLTEVAEQSMKQIYILWAIYVGIKLVQTFLTAIGIIKMKYDELGKAVMKKLEELREAGGEVLEQISRDALAFTGQLAVAFGGLVRDTDAWAKSLKAVNQLMTFLIKQGSVSRGEWDALDETWAKLIADAKKYGMEGTKAFTDMILKARELGQEIPALTAYINEQLGLITSEAMNASEGLQAMATGAVPGLNELMEKQKEFTTELSYLEKGTEEYDKMKLAIEQNKLAMEALGEGGTVELARIERQAIATFNAMIANGASYMDAMTALAPTLDILIEKHKAMGTEGSLAIEALMHFRKVIEANEDLFNALEGNLGVLTALGNTASLTEETFADSATQAGVYYDQLLEAGLTSNQALATMGPTLLELEKFAEQYGFTLDDNTLSMIKQEN